MALVSAAAVDVLKLFVECTGVGCAGWLVLNSVLVAASGHAGLAVSAAAVDDNAVWSTCRTEEASAWVEVGS